MCLPKTGGNILWQLPMEFINFAFVDWVKQNNILP